MNIVVSGFSPSNKRPGFFGRQIFATGSTAGQLFGMICCVVGMGSGSAVVDGPPVPINSQDDVATLAGVSSIGGQMLMGAMQTPGLTLNYARPANPGGAVAATWECTVGGTWTSGGQIKLRPGGFPVNYIIQPTDTPTLVAAGLAALINAIPNGPFSAANTAGKLTVTVLTAGAHGDQYLNFSDTSLVPSGLTFSSTGVAWVTATAYATGAYVVPPTGNGIYYKVTTGGTSGTAPTWPLVLGGTATDGGGVVYTAWGFLTNGSGSTFGGGAGTPNYTNIIASMSTAQYDLIAIGENDATNLGLLKTFVDGQMAATIGLLNAVVFATNTLTITQAQALSTTTLNDPAFENLFAPSSETHPAVLAATHAADRSVVESSNPNPRYLNRPILGAVPQVSKSDWQTDTTANALLNAGVTPCTTTPDGGTFVVMRAVTTYCRTTGGAQDTRCLDVNEFTMSKYARMRISALWNDSIVDDYEEAQDDPPPEGPDPDGGVLFPELLNSLVTEEQQAWEKNGWVVAGSVAQYPTVVQFSPTARNFLMDLTVVPTPGNYQLGANIRQRPY